MSEAIEVQSSDAGGDSYIADREELEKKAKVKIHPNAFVEAPQGARCFVVLEEVPTQIGEVVVPESVVSDNRHDVGRAWVISCGPYVGKGDLCSRYPYSPLVEHPGELVGKRVLIPGHVGVVLRFTMADENFNAPILVINDMDIVSICIDQNPNTIREDMEAYLNERYGSDLTLTS